MDQLFALLYAIAPLSKDCETYLRSILRKASYPANEWILKEGEICKNIYFLVSGFVRVYHHPKDKQITTWFLKENGFVISVLSFFQQTKSYEYIITLEPCEFLYISIEQLDELCLLYPEFNVHYKYILKMYYCLKEERDHKMARQNPAERVAQLIENEFYLIKRAGVELVCSYLGISPRTFSIKRTEYEKNRGIKIPRTKRRYRKP